MTNRDVPGATPLAHGVDPSPDLSDAELGHVIGVGSVFGMAAIFLVVVVVCLGAGTTLGQAVGVAALPTLFGGWFYGGTVMMLRAADHASRTAVVPVAEQADRRKLQGGGR